MRMSYDLNKVLREYLDTVKDDIRSEIRSQSRYASGWAYNTLRVVGNQILKAELRGVGYLQFLQTGVGSKPRSVSPSFTQRIMQWMRAKGIQPRGGNLRRSAGGIARSISRKGTAIKRGQRGIDIDGILQDNLTPALEGVAAEILKDFSNGLKIGSNTNV